MSNGDDTFVLTKILGGDTVVVDIIGDFGPDPGSGFTVGGVENATQNNTLIRKSSVTQGNAGDWLASAGATLDDSEWVIQPQNDWSNLGEHAFDWSAACFALPVLGCTDELACNYDHSADEADGTCAYPEEGLDCEGFCLDSNLNMFCDLDEQDVFGPVTVVLDSSFDSGELAGHRSYLVYLEFEHPDDELWAVVGLPDELKFQIQAPSGCWDPIGGSYVLGENNPSIAWENEGQELNEFDTFWTIGMLSSDDNGVLPDTTYNGNTIVAETPGSTALACNLSIQEGGMQMVSSADNAVAGEGLRVLIARVTTAGDFLISGNAEIWVQGNAGNVQVVPFQKYVIAPLAGCLDVLSCNYDPFATYDDGTCNYPELGTDCEGNCLVDLDE